MNKILIKAKLYKIIQNLLILINKINLIRIYLITNNNYKIYKCNHLKNLTKIKKIKVLINRVKKI